MAGSVIIDRNCKELTFQFGTPWLNLQRGAEEMVGLRNATVGIPQAGVCRLEALRTPSEPV